MASAFAFITNTTMTFKVPSGGTEIDRNGNTVPKLRDVVVKAYLTPQPSNKTPKAIRDQYVLDVSAQYLIGYVTSPDVLPKGIEPGSRAKAVYTGAFLGSKKKQTGTVILFFNMQSSVGADSITGQTIQCVFVVSGGDSTKTH